MEDGEINENENDDNESASMGQTDAFETSKTFSLRKRKENVIYDDGMSDLQFQKYVDRQITDNNDHILSTKKARVEKSLSTELSQLNGTNGTTSGIYKDVQTALQDVMKMKKSDGQKLCFWFMEKPSKKAIPQYYSVIQQPISLKEIGL